MRVLHLIEIIAATACTASVVTLLGVGVTNLAKKPEPAPVVKVEEAKIDQREVQILALFIGRNPGTSIDDFQDVPRTLLSESRRCGIDYRVILATIEKESQFKIDAVSYAGAIGPMQVMPDTGADIAKAMGWPFVPPVKSQSGKGYASLGSLGNPSYNIRAGIIHLCDHVTRYGMNATAFRAYNRGEVHAREHRPSDQYAEHIALNALAFVSRFQEESR